MAPNLVLKGWNCVLFLGEAEGKEGSGVGKGTLGRDGLSHMRLSSLYSQLCINSTLFISVLYVTTQTKVFF